MANGSLEIDVAITPHEHLSEHLISYPKVLMYLKSNKYFDVRILPPLLFLLGPLSSELPVSGFFCHLGFGVFEIAYACAV